MRTEDLKIKNPLLRGGVQQPVLRLQSVQISIAIEDYNNTR